MRTSADPEAHGLRDEPDMTHRRDSPKRSVGIDAEQAHNDAAVPLAKSCCRVQFQAAAMAAGGSEPLDDDVSPQALREPLPA